VRAFTSQCARAAIRRWTIAVSPLNATPVKVLLPIGTSRKDLLLLDQKTDGLRLSWCEASISAVCIAKRIRSSGQADECSGDAGPVFRISFCAVSDVALLNVLGSAADLAGRIVE
jgi:hypothetical protein